MPKRSKDRKAFELDTTTVRSRIVKKLILSKGSLLKGTNITISPDLTFSQREDNKILRKHLMEARAHSSTKSFIKGNILHIGQKSYTIKELKIAQLEREIGGEPNIGKSVVEAESSASQIWSQPSSNREKHKVKNQPIKTSARLAGIQRGRIDSA
ncbi:hypothetical protein HHI36_013429 [Cryptolaemus montrouzieri]|uniref:Uncharacterized protein n=1 Tax=Cryptolaemus montrouzieri TaxID=559131 RepID=A0ABD2NHT9_9CUCU